MSDPIQTLIEYFSHFPGVGPRQAKRFAYYMLTRDSATIKGFVDNIVAAKKNVGACISCMRLFSSNTKTNLCQICADETRDNELLMVVGHDTDVESVEKSGVYRGHYFVLGGTVPILEQKPEERVRIKKLSEIIQKRLPSLQEVILALDLNPEGEHTMEYVSKFLADLVAKNSLKITLLGRGLSTGTELQYSDPETIKNALSNRAQVK